MGGGNNECKTRRAGGYSKSKTRRAVDCMGPVTAVNQFQRRAAESLLPDENNDLTPRGRDYLT